MADKFIQMAQRNTGNTDWDNLYPQGKFETAGGTATAITLTIPNLVDGVSKTFIASASNNGAATTINGKSLYKPNTTTAPTLIAGKAYTVWYSAANTCFFIKASTEGDATVADVLAGKIFSNGEDVGLIGTLEGKQDLSDYLLNLPKYYEPIGFVDGEGLWCSYTSSNSGLEYKAALFNSSGTLVKSLNLTINNSASGRIPYHVTDEYILWSNGDKAFTVGLSDKQGNHISSYTTNVPDAGDYPNPNGGCLNDKAGIVYVHTSSSDFIIYNINGTLLHTVHVASMDTALYMVPIKGGIIAGCQNSNTKDLNVILIKDNGDSKVIDAKNFGVGQIFSNTIKL